MPYHNDLPIYEWDSSGGCERCDNLERFHEDEPPRPHPNCDCEINEHDYDRDKEFHPPVFSECYYAYLEFEQTELPDLPPSGQPDPLDEMTLHFSYEIVCWNGAGESGEVEVPLTFQELYDDYAKNNYELGENFADAEDEAEQKVEIIAWELCNCPDFYNYEEDPDDFDDFDEFDEDGPI